jgi:tol-pal system protein YbgF
MKRPLLLAPALLGLAACATNPADDPVQARLNDVDTRLGRVERVVSNQSLVDMSRRLDTLEAQLREQRGNVEVLQNGSEGVRKQQRDLYADLDKRISTLEAGARASGNGASGGTAGGTAGSGAGGAAGGSGGNGVSATAGEDQAAYGRAFEQLKGGDYSAAITQFQAFMKSYPQSSLLDNAQYWVGEAYYVTRDYEQAARAFTAVGERWPGSRKAPDALLKLGYTQFEQKRLTEARTTLQQVTQRYPGTEAARLAGERLQKLPTEGR